MADNQIDNLSIQVTASAGKAASVFDRLASSAGRLRGAAYGAAGGMQDMAQVARDAGTATSRAGEQSGRAAPLIRQTGKAAKEAGDDAKKGSTGIATFWQSLKRIAYYRFIRSVIRGITSAFSEGIKNLYHWSAAVDGTFAKSMDRLASSTLYLKNSLGAMLAPIIERLTPVIEWIIDRIVDAINWINKLFAALSGSQTYIVAKKVATKWQDAGKNVAGSAKSAADDIRRTLLGFDEINRLDSPNKSSGGGGYSASGDKTDYTNMFEERKLDGWMSKLASFIDKFKLGVPAVLGGILAGFAAIKKAIKAVSSLSLGWLKNMAGKTVDIAVSLVRKGWKTIKDWALSFGQAVVDLAVKIKTSALELWAKFATRFAALNPVLKVGIVASVTAAALWAAYRLAWALAPDKVLEIKAKFVTTATQLRDGLVRGWAFLGSWALNVKLRLATTAAQLKNDIINGWNKLTPWALSVALRLNTSATQLKNSVVKAWYNLVSWALDVKLRIGTSIKDLWNLVKKNWKTVAAVALGVAIAIATPWSTIAASLSALWSEVMASFGGSLAFGVTPMYDPVVEGQKKADAMKKKVPVSKYGVSALPGGGSADRGGPSAGRNKKNIEKVKVSVSLERDGWKSLSDWVGTDLTVKTSLQRLGWTTLADWIGNSVVAFVSLAKKNWSSLGSWVGNSVTAYVNLVRGNFRSLSDWIGKTINVGVNLFSNWINRRKNGGAFANGIWSSIPQYANGTRDAHGSLFWAGEAGPEIVGHVGGRTEVLNKSQLASTMYSSVVSAMIAALPAVVYAAREDSSMDSDGGGIDYNRLADAMVSAMQRAGIGAVYLDGRQLAQSINRESRRLGTPAVTF